MPSGGMMIFRFCRIIGGIRYLPARKSSSESWKSSCSGKMWRVWSVQPMQGSAVRWLKRKKKETSSRWKSNFKVIKGAIQMKRNQNFDHNHSQKLLSFRYNIDTNRVEARFTDGSAVANRMPNCLRTSSTRYFTVGLTRRIECHRFFMATAENHCNVFCVTNWSSEWLWLKFSYSHNKSFDKLVKMPNSFKS